MNATDRPVHGPDGTYGSVDTTCWPSRDEKPELEVDLRLPDGQHVTVPADVLIAQNDGSFYVPLHQHDIDKMIHRDHAAPGTDDCWSRERKPREKELMAGDAQGRLRRVNDE